MDTLTDEFSKYFTPDLPELVVTEDQSFQVLSFLVNKIGVCLQVNLQLNNNWYFKDFVRYQIPQIFL